MGLASVGYPGLIIKLPGHFPLTDLPIQMFRHFSLCYSKYKNRQHKILKPTSILSHSLSLLAFSSVKPFPAFVKNTVGMRNFPSELISLLKDSGTLGIIFFPLTMTPSISNSSPNEGASLCKENNKLV